MSGQKRWYSWVIKRNRIANVIEHIQANCPEIDAYFYPQIKKEYRTKTGVKVKDRPLYEGYLFLHYDSHPIVFHKLSTYPFVTTYAGLVTDDEINTMQAAQGKLLSEIKASQYSSEDEITVKSGPFKGFEAKVVKVVGDEITVQIFAKILGKRDVEVVYKEHQVERRVDLQDTKIQTIRE